MLTAVILAGGFGTRLRSTVPDVPKPMAPISGRPFLEHLLDFLVKQHFTTVILSIGHMGEIITSHFGARYRTLSVSYLFEQRPLGTGGAIRASLDHCECDPVFVFNGDTYIDVDCDTLYQKWKASREPILVGRYVEDTGRYGSLMIEGERVVGLLEKQATGPGVINAGCYVLPTDLFRGYEVATPFAFEKDFLSQSLRDRPFRIHMTHGTFIDIGIASDYNRAQVMLPGFVE